MASAAEKLNTASRTRPEPEPLLAETGVAPEFPIDALGEFLSAGVRAIAKLAVVPPALAAQSVLATASLCSQPHFDVRLPFGATAPLSLFFLTVADSGDRKTGADKLALRPIMEFEERLQRDFRESAHELRAAMDAHKEMVSHIKQTYKKQGREALERALADLGPPPQDETQPTFIVAGGTIEGLLKYLRTSRPSIALMTSEGGLWIGGHGMTEENRVKTIALLSEIWDGSPVKTMTSGEGFNVLYGRRLCFHILAQQSIAAELLGDPKTRDQGFLNRMLVTAPTSLAGTRFIEVGEEPDPTAVYELGLYHTRMARLVQVDLPVGDDPADGLDPRILSMDAEATAAWQEYHNELEAKIGKDGEYHAIKGFVAKLPEMAARLAGCIALCNNNSGTPLDCIDVKAMSAGIEVSRYYLLESDRLFGKQAADPEVIDAKELSDWLASGWKENLVSVTAISQHGPNRLRQGAAFIKRLLGILEEAKHVTKCGDGGDVMGKRATTAWRIHVGRN